MWMQELPVPETITEKEVHRVEKLISRKKLQKYWESVLQHWIRHVAVFILPMCSMWRMARRRQIPKYGTVVHNGVIYYRTRIRDADGKRVALYGKTREELYDKVEEAKRQIEDKIFRQKTPTVKEYTEKWLYMQSAHVRYTTMLDYTSKVKNYIIQPLGDMYMADVTQDDIKMALVPVSKKSKSVYHSVVMLLKCIFYSAEDNHLIRENPFQGRYS